MQLLIIIVKYDKNMWLIMLSLYILMHISS